MGKTITIDGKKLRALLKAKKINAAQASRDIGMTDSYVSNCIGYNYIAKAPAMLLEAKYGIMMDDYKYVEPPKPVEPEPELTEQKIIEEIKAAPTAVIPQSGMTEDDWNRIAGMIAAMAVDYDKIGKAVTEGMIEATHVLVTTEPVTRQIQQMVFNALNGTLKRLRNDLK